MAETMVGSVVGLWRYPVKSMMGEELNAVDVTERGLLGDRAYALVDHETGKVASAKFPRKWPTLFDHRATFVDVPQLGQALPSVRITVPDGRQELGGGESPTETIHQLLSDELGREVTLAKVPPDSPSLEEYWPDMEGLAFRETVTDESMPTGTFFDIGIVHLLTTATLDRLRELNPQGRFEVRRFRPNIVVAPIEGATGFVENDWVGRSVGFGEGADEVRLRITQPCTRCVMTTLAQGDLPKDPGILRAAAQHNDVNVGVYATVQRSGRLRRGDAIKLLD